MEKLTPMESVKAVCRNCLGNRILTEDLIKNCEGDNIECVFYPYRLGKRISVKTIRKYCLKSCMIGYRDLVESCTTEKCANHPYRLGTNPAYFGADRKAGTNALRKWRETARGIS